MYSLFSCWNNMVIVHNDPSTIRYPVV